MRVAVIGGGIIGLLCAHHLAKRGAEVVLVERGRVGAGCSAGNAGWVTPSISTPLPAPGLRWQALHWMLKSDAPLYIKPTAAPRMLGFLLAFWRHCNARDFERGTEAFARLNQDTLALYDELAADGIDFESRTGLLMVFRQRERLRAEREFLEGIGYGPLEVLSANELRELEPCLESHDVVGGIHVLPELTVRPEQVCASTARRLREHGCEILENTSVEALRREAGRVVAGSLRGESAGDLEADAFLIATGAEAAALSRSCGQVLPLQAGKGYSITIERPETEVRHSLYLSEPNIAITPFAGALRIAGTMELSGINLHLDPRRVEAIRRAAECEVPGIMEGGGHHEWVGMRPLTPDGLPVLGPLAGLPNLHVATGHQMLGVTLAPSTGKAMAQRILTGTSDVDLTPFSPSRFG